jgi:NADPH-dependent glutamate synthase beta subunit-like oxidoreductase
MGMSETICPVQDTIKSLTNHLEAGALTTPRSRYTATRMLGLLHAVACGTAPDGALEKIQRHARELADSADGDQSREVGGQVLEALQRHAESFAAHVTSRNCVTGDCLPLTPAPCQLACPAGIDVPAYISLIGEGRYDEAIEVIRRVNPLPWVCGLVCTRPCESACVRGQFDAPVSIKFLKAFAAEKALSEGRYANPPKARYNHKKVCIIGAGPAGLTAAYYLALKGYAVRVIEELPYAGGMLLVGIPRYRLPQEVIDREVEMITSLGVEFQFNTRFGWRLHMNQLRREGFGAFLFTIGAHKCSPMRIPGENDFAEVYTAVSFLREVALGEGKKPGHRVVVIGGGNVAVDSARTCIRLGCEEVFLAYRRSRVEMPADHEEIEQAEEEGVKLSLLTIPLEITGEDYRVTGVQFIKAKLVSVEGSRRKRPVPIEGSEFFMPADAVIAAVGQRIDHVIMNDLPDLQWSRWDTIEADPVIMQTSLDGMYAAGDVVSGPDTVIGAIAGGKRAAEAIHRQLEGLVQPKQPPVPQRCASMPLMEMGADLKMERQRPQMALLNMIRRKVTFQQVELGYDEQTAQMEAGRCLRCDVCVRCGTCARTCREMMQIDALRLDYLEADIRTGTDFRYTAQQCILCGACAVNCPTGAMRVEDRKEERLLLMCGTILNRQPLVRCNNCGEVLGTQRHLDYVAARTEEANPKVVTSTGCPVCSRAAWGKTKPDRLAFQQ